MMSTQTNEVMRDRQVLVLKIRTILWKLIEILDIFRITTVYGNHYNISRALSVICLDDFVIKTNIFKNEWSQFQDQ